MGSTSPIRTTPILDAEKSHTIRTGELATDQSIVARNLIYNPNDSALSVIKNCAAGIDSIMNRLKPTVEPVENLKRDEILVSMVARLMANGGTGRLEKFDERLAALDKMKKEDSMDYALAVNVLAKECRDNMSQITKKAIIPGPDGAVARQGILAFMGDLGGMLPVETGFNKIPCLCKIKDVYNALVAGTCDAQNRLKGLDTEASEEQVGKFEEEFANAKKATSQKGGVLSATVSTRDKKGQRQIYSADSKERKGLLDKGDNAQEILQKANLCPETVPLLNASWPSFYVPEELIQGVLEPVTGHISGTFGEMVTSMNMFCGTDPSTVAYANPTGALDAKDPMVVSMGALAAAGLISAGFHSAVEVYQPMSTFTTHATFGSLGPKAVMQMQRHAEALRDYAEARESADPPTSWSHKSFTKQELQGLLLTKEVENNMINGIQPELEEDELNLDKESLLSKAQSIDDAATKSQDMISLVQGSVIEGGATIPTLDVSTVMARQSTHPEVLKLMSLTSRMEMVGLQNGATPELEKARALAAEEPCDQTKLKAAVEAAEEASDKIDSLVAKVTSAGQRVGDAAESVSKIEAVLEIQEANLAKAKKVSDEALTNVYQARQHSPEDAAKARASVHSLELASKLVAASKVELKTAKAEATDAKSEATAAKTELETAKKTATSEAKIVRSEAVATKIQDHKAHAAGPDSTADITAKSKAELVAMKEAINNNVNKAEVEHKAGSDTPAPGAK